MPSTTVRISEKSREALRALSEESGEPMQSILDKAIEEYQRKHFFEQLNADYEALGADPEAWAEYKKELELWDATLMDGLDPNEHWTEGGEAAGIAASPGGCIPVDRKEPMYGRRDSKDQ
jgi:hypothetical protein